MVHLKKLIFIFTFCRFELILEKINIGSSFSAKVILEKIQYRFSFFQFTFIFLVKFSLSALLEWSHQRSRCNPTIYLVPVLERKVFLILFLTSSQIDTKLHFFSGSPFLDSRKYSIVFASVAFSFIKAGLKFFRVLIVLIGERECKTYFYSSYTAKQFHLFANWNDTTFLASFALQIAHFFSFSSSQMKSFSTRKYSIAFPSSTFDNFSIYQRLEGTHNLNFTIFAY